MEEVPESAKFFPAQLVFLALGFLGPQAELINALGIKQDARSNIQTPHKVGLLFLVHGCRPLTTATIIEIFYQCRRCLCRR
jgi:NADPH-dependent glutamate synthase beta subunit-like oxidoreductase